MGLGLMLQRLVLPVLWLKELNPKNGPITVSYIPDLLANQAPLSGRSGIGQVRHKTICLQGDERELEGLFKKYKSGEEILGKITASRIKSKNLLIFKSYW